MDTDSLHHTGIQLGPPVSTIRLLGYMNQCTVYLKIDTIGSCSLAIKILLIKYRSRMA